MTTPNPLYLEAKAELEQETQARQQRQATPAQPLKDGDGTAYGLAALEAECAKVATCRENRNECLNAAAFVLSQLCGGGELSQGIIESGLFDAACQCGLDTDPGCGPDGIRRTIKSGIEKGMLQPRQAPAPREMVTNVTTENPVNQEHCKEEMPDPWETPLDINNILNVQPPAISWLMKERIPLGRGTLLAGLGGSSKTRVLTHLGVAVAVGRLPWPWEVVTTGKALLVLTEDTADDTHRALYSICANLEPAEKEAVQKSIVAYPLAGRDCKLLTRARNGNLVKTGLFISLEAKIKELGGVVFVGLDPALSLTDGDEMDQGNQRTLGKMVDDLAVRTGATVCLVAHAAKGNLQKEELDSHTSRGGGAITDALRAEYSVRNMTPAEAAKAGITDLEERKRHVQLVATKGNGLPPSAYVPVWLRRGDFGALHEAEVDLSGNRGPNTMDLKALEILKELSTTSTPALKEWRAACLDAGVIKRGTDEAQTKAMQRTKDHLRIAGLIGPGHGKGVWIPKLNHKEGTF